MNVTDSELAVLRERLIEAQDAIEKGDVDRARTCVRLAVGALEHFEESLRSEEWQHEGGGAESVGG